MDENSQKYFGAALRLFEEGQPEDTFEEYKDKLEVSDVKPQFAQGEFGNILKEAVEVAAGDEPMCCPFMTMMNATSF